MTVRQARAPWRILPPPALLVQPRERPLQAADEIGHDLRDCDDAESFAVQNQPRIP
jgi:hypothetical protein